jgi:hypothetical protein
MQYEFERTRGVVNRLVLLGNNLRLALILINAALFGVLFGIFGALVGGWPILALIGVIIGLGSGFFLSGALAVVFEWMAQVLISLQPRE